MKILWRGWREQFLSTPSARRATCNAPKSKWPYIISIHALREEGDSAFISAMTF